MPRRVRRHHSAASPEVELAEGLASYHILDAIPDLYRAVQIAQNRHKGDADQAHKYGRPARRGTKNADAIVQLSSGRSNEVVDDTVHAADGEREECRHGEVECCRRHNAGHPDEHRREELPPIVVVEVAAAEPRVIRRHNCRPQHRVQIREVHRLLAAAIGMPQVRIRHPHQHERKKRRKKYQLRDHQRCPAPPHKVDNFLPSEYQDAERYESHQRNGKRD